MANSTQLVSSLTPDQIVAEQLNSTGGNLKLLAVKLHGGALNADGGPDPAGGSLTGTVASAAANTVIKASGGRLCTVLVTTAGSGTGNVSIYDNATTNSGTIIGQIPATVTVNNLYSFNTPAANGITVANVASGPVLTISYN